MKYRIRDIATVGTYHKVSEDSYEIGENYLIIADGMGGEVNGLEASRIAVDSIGKVLKTTDFKRLDDRQIEDQLTKAIYQADTNIRLYSSAHPESFSMGTTVLIAVFIYNKLYIAWCGDSHAYLYRDNKLESITKDHSLVNELIKNGKLKPEDAFSHPDNNVLTRYVGGGSGSCKPETTICDIIPGNMLICCTDGISGYCKESEISDCIAKNTKADNLNRHLVNLALSRGSVDDITLIIVSFYRRGLSGILLDLIR